MEVGLGDDLRVKLDTADHPDISKYSLRLGDQLIHDLQPALEDDKKVVVVIPLKRTAVNKDDWAGCWAPRSRSRAS
jgi:hypothetical protein